MTIEEHKLLIVMFARQAMLLRVMADNMRSHGLLSDEDLKLFDLYVLDSEKKNPRIAQAVAELYSDIAKTLGLDVSVERRTK